MGRAAPKHARGPSSPAGPVATAAGTAAGRAAGRAAGSPARLPVPSGQTVLPAPEPVGRRSAGTVVAACALLAVGVAALVCALVLDQLGTGGRTIAGLAAAWAFVVGGSALRRPGPPPPA